jgi:hypothetical protein
MTGLGCYAVSALWVVSAEARRRSSIPLFECSQGRGADEDERAEHGRRDRGVRRDQRRYRQAEDGELE